MTKPTGNMAKSKLIRELGEKALAKQEARQQQKDGFLALARILALGIVDEVRKIKEPQEIHGITSTPDGKLHRHNSAWPPYELVQKCLDHMSVYFDSSSSKEYGLVIRVWTGQSAMRNKALNKAIAELITPDMIPLGTIVCFVYADCRSVDGPRINGTGVFK